MDPAIAGPPMGTKALKGPKACATCARAKSRCIPGPGGQEKCERCHRLAKPCSSQTPAPARKRKQPKPTRVAELERRLEDLSARIESVQRAGSGAPSSPDSDHYGLPPCNPSDPERLPPPRNLSGHRPPVPTFGGARWESPLGHIFPNRSIFDTQHEVQYPTANGLVVAAQGTPPSVASGLASHQTTTAAASMTSSPNQLPSSHLSQQQAVCPWPQGDEAEACLEMYRKDMAHLLPFVVVPPHMSAAQLQEQRPFMWKAIMMEACLFDGDRQVALGNELLREISEAAYVMPHKNLDLLHGLQMLIAWYHYNLNNFQMVNLLFLARSITTSLGSVELQDSPEGEGYSSECLELMRAFAGTYYFVTITFTTNKRPDALMNNVNTSYLVTCCRALHNQMEYPTDELLVHLVRAQQVAQGIGQAFARRKAIPNKNRVPQAAFIQSLRDRIQSFAASPPPHIRANISLVGHYQVAEIMVYENSLEELSHCLFGDRSRGQGPMAVVEAASMSEADSDRVEMLSQCARLVRAFMDIRFGRDVGEYPSFICLSSFDMTYVFITMLKLGTLQVPGWDLARVRAEIRFEETMTQLIKRMEHTSERRKKKTVNGTYSGGMSVDGHEGEPEDPYIKLARKVRTVRDLLHVNGFDSDYAKSQIARVCDPLPMTLADATQDLMHDLGGELWQDAPSGISEWDSLFAGETLDWASVFNNYSMGDPGYVAT